MEKRRRARINESLGQLKTLILDALKKDVSWCGEGTQIASATLEVGGGGRSLGSPTVLGIPESVWFKGAHLSPPPPFFFHFLQSSRHSKLEKADILEMTVKHLRNLQRAQMTGE